MTTTLMQEQLWLSKQQAATRVGVSQKTIQRWMHSGKLAYSRVGNVVRIKPEALEETLREQNDDEKTE